jgi:hypothetical protein
MSAIEWAREGRRVLIPVVVYAPYPATDLTGVEAKALLDTGSSVCGLAARLANDLGLVRLGKRPLTSAHGEGQIERYAFRIGFRPDSGSHEAPAFPFVFDEVIGIDRQLRVRRTDRNGHSWPMRL